MPLLEQNDWRGRTGEARGADLPWDEQAAILGYNVPSGDSLCEPMR